MADKQHHNDTLVHLQEEAERHSMFLNINSHRVSYIHDCFSRTEQTNGKRRTTNTLQGNGAKMFCTYTLLQARVCDTKFEDDPGVGLRLKCQHMGQNGTLMSNKGAATGMQH